MLKKTIRVQKAMQENFAFCAVIFFVVLSKKRFEYMPYYNRNILNSARSFLQR